MKERMKLCLCYPLQELWWVTADVLGGGDDDSCLVTAVLFTADVAVIGYHEWHTTEDGS